MEVDEIILKKNKTDRGQVLHVFFYVWKPQTKIIRRLLRTMKETEGCSGISIVFE